MEPETYEPETFDNVFEALCDTAAEAANMKARAELMLAIRERIAAWGIAQDQAARPDPASAE